MPPMNPTVPVLDAIAAIIPTRKLPSCSVKTTDFTFGWSTTMSMIANLVSGKSGATVFSTSPKAKPVITTGFAPASARRRSACSRWASDCISISLKVPPVSSAQRVAPLKAASLNDLSNLPPRSKMIAGSAAAAPADSATRAVAPRNFCMRVIRISRLLLSARAGPPALDGGPISCGSQGIRAAAPRPVNRILSGDAAVIYLSVKFPSKRPAA